MARSTCLRNEWAISLLDMRSTDRILEVGFSPGAMVQALAARATEGFIAGVDVQLVTLWQACRRNALAIGEGRVQLRQGSALALPFEDASFDTALSANSVQLWPDQVGGVKEIQRVLRPGGVIAIILQPVWARTEREVKEIGAGVLAMLSSVGFQQARLEFKPMKPITSVCALGIK